MEPTAVSPAEAQGETINGSKKKTEVDRLRDEVDRLHGPLGDKDAEVDRLRGPLGDKDAEVDRLRGLLAEKDEKIQQMQRENSEEMNGSVTKMGDYNPMDRFSRASM